MRALALQSEGLNPGYGSAQPIVIFEVNMKSLPIIHWKTPVCMCARVTWKRKHLPQTTSYQSIVVVEPSHTDTIIHMSRFGLFGGQDWRSDWTRDHIWQAFVFNVYKKNQERAYWYIVKIKMHTSWVAVPPLHTATVPVSSSGHGAVCVSQAVSALALTCCSPYVKGNPKCHSTKNRAIPNLPDHSEGGGVI